MKKTIAFLLLCVSGITFTQAESLCGVADQAVCMTNSTTIQINCQGNSYRPGSRILLKVPGMVTEAAEYSSGQPDVPYWFSDTNGIVTDSLNNTWSQATPLYIDDKGNRIIAFDLQSNYLYDVVNIQLNNISICQFVSDGPRPVTLIVEFWPLLNLKTNQLSFSKTMGDSFFEECIDYQGYLPATQPGDELFVVNPWDANVLVTVDNQSYTMVPASQLKFEGGTLKAINSSNKLGLVVHSMEEDLNLVTILSKDYSSYLVPHISNNPESWVNQWRLAAGSPSQVQYLIYGSDVQTASVPAGLSTLSIETQPGQPNTWMRLNSTHPTNGYFVFNRVDGISGGAAINGLRPVEKPFGSPILNLTHVAGDSDHFWTGFSLVNPNEQTATATLTGYMQDGSVFAVESISLNPGEKRIEVIGENLFTNFDGLSWIQIQSDIPLAGLELFGGQNEQQPYLAGFLLSSDMGSRISFPLVNTQEDWWSGISLLNPSDSEASGQLIFYDAQSMVIHTQGIQLDAREKQLVLAPEGSTQALWKGDACSAFLLVGDDARQHLGGYLGMNIEP